ncbi:hypothetical protein SERLA73DRAFT_187037 [Serpula lacrymans var. lacrymans S7.3]|uniref:Uncharacterized protein n=2 Tax=Serpula lacrymans var. lacrymans TaxID=341189 RepID=F8Q8C6_SERL3|nr:uncharacterized protein SERLADRAFT_476374 [Serpula lacrymans var. lacrymans S7.9]EGN95814.1 hypothetical protein SERLA73DRAFT_187037 [Serpula lacrymans var. lacrymans S7.3]EGO21336.1 hypothetical protein SERLADRAFT_476374 [Serpula lacrymans var. lacrymans S7.9]
MLNSLVFRVGESVKMINGDRRPPLVSKQTYRPPRCSASSDIYPKKLELRASTNSNAQASCTLSPTVVTKHPHNIIQKSRDTSGLNSFPRSQTESD